MNPATCAPGLRATLRELFGRSGAYRTVLLAVLVVGVAIRVALVTNAHAALLSDARDYYELARSLTEGRGYEQFYVGETEAFNEFTFRAFRPPGYPVFLAGLRYVAGWRPVVGLAANVVVDLLTQLCFVLIACRVFGRGSALIVAVLLTIHVVWTPSLMSEALYTALFAVLALLLVFRIADGSIIGAILFGLVMGAALFTRPITVCVLPLLVWHMLGQHSLKRGGVLLLLAVVPSAVGITLWGARNQRLFGQFVPLTTNLGHHNAWDYGLHADRVFAHLRGEGLNEAEINDVFLALEWEFVRKHPGTWVLMCLGRARDLFSLEPPPELRQVLWKRTFDCGSDGSLIGRIYRAAYSQYYITYVLAGLGVCVLAVRRHSVGGLWVVLVAYIVVHALVSRGDVRLVAPLYPIMCVLAAGTWWAVRGRAASTDGEAPADAQ